MPMRLATLVTLVTFATSALGAHIQRAHNDRAQRRSASTSWYHSDDHPAVALFRRALTDGNTYPPVGTPEWSSSFPGLTFDTSTLPQPWLSALRGLVGSGKIPNITQSTVTPQGLITYGTLDPAGPEVCSSYHQCYAADDIWNAPQGVVGLSFDDGPLPSSNTLYKFLSDNTLRATHFFIGSNIIQYPSQFSMAFDQLGDDIGVHTWTHPYMTTLSNEQIIGELGWTMQLIHNSTGGRLPKYWRPPYGDCDNRVRAIAKEVFGLTAIFWNQDTSDWSLTSGGTTKEVIQTKMQGWLTGPKNPGLIILEHELSNQSVQAFMDAYPLMKSNGWSPLSVTEFTGGPVYQNSQNSTAPVTLKNVIGSVGLPSSVSPSVSPSASPSASPLASTLASPPPPHQTAGL